MARRGFSKARTYQFEHTRVVVHAIAMTSRGPGQPYVTLENFWPLETDDVESDEEIAKRLKQKIKDALAMYPKT